MTDPELIARAVVLHHGAVLLMQERAVGYWFFPGGHVEAGESPEDAVARELREELDVGATITERWGEAAEIIRATTGMSTTRARTMTHVRPCSLMARKLGGSPTAPVPFGGAVTFS